MTYPRHCPLCGAACGGSTKRQAGSDLASEFRHTTLSAEPGGTPSPREPALPGRLLRLRCRICRGEYTWDYFGGRPAGGAVPPPRPLYGRGRCGTGGTAMADRDGARLAAVRGDALDDVLAVLNATMDRVADGLEAPEPEVLRARLGREIDALRERWDPDVLADALADALTLAVRRLRALEEGSPWDAASWPHVLAGGRSC